MNPPTETNSAGPERFVLLGASNLTLAFPMLLQTLHGIPARSETTAAATEELSARSGVEVLAAHGHGRSYGMWTRVLMRSLPGILQTGLWEMLADRCTHSPGRTRALITDVGNDILYNAPVSQILGWVESCLERLAACQAEIIVTLLPLESVERLNPRQFVMLRSLMFPTCRLDLPTVRERAQTISDRLVDLSQQYGASIVAPRGEWYGFDPIHIRHRYWREAWTEILQPWQLDSSVVVLRQPNPVRKVRTWCLSPEERRLAGWKQGAAQPVWQNGVAGLWLF